MQTLKKRLGKMRARPKSSLGSRRNNGLSISNSFEAIHIDTDSEANLTSQSGSLDSASTRDCSPDHADDIAIPDWPASQPDIMQHITERDEALFRIIRSRCPTQLLDSPYNTDFNLKRWLMAYNYDLDKIVPKLGAHVSYRCAMNLDLVSDMNPFSDPLMCRYHPKSDFWIKAKDDSLVQVLALGKLDIKGLLLSTPSSAIITSRIVYTEQCLQKIMQKEHECDRRTGITWVLDLEGLKYDSWTLSAVNGPFKVLAEFLLANYVEIAKRILIVNAGKLLYAVWKIIQPMVPQKTKDKIHIFDSNWKLQIRQFIEPAVLPKRWGGDITNEDFDRHVGIPMRVSEEYYYSPALGEPPDMILEHRVLARHAYQLEEFYVADENSYLQWYFKADGEVTFGIFHSADRHPKCSLSLVKGQLVDKDLPLSQIEMVYPLLNLCPTYIPEQGKFMATKAGWYYVMFGNCGRVFSRNIKFQMHVQSSTICHWNSLRLEEEKSLASVTIIDV